MHMLLLKTGCCRHHRRIVSQASLVPTSTARPRGGDEEGDTTAAPKRSPKEIATLEKERQQQKLSCLEELLAVTADMPEIDLPLPQVDIVLELASFGTIQPALGCMDIRESAEARLQSAGVSRCTDNVKLDNSFLHSCLLRLFAFVYHVSVYRGRPQAMHTNLYFATLHKTVHAHVSV